VFFDCWVLWHLILWGEREWLGDSVVERCLKFFFFGGRGGRLAGIFGFGADCESILMDDCMWFRGYCGYPTMTTVSEMRKVQTEYT
jgi:hypothetical protein